MRPRSREVAVAQPPYAVVQCQSTFSMPTLRRWSSHAPDQKAQRSFAAVKPLASPATCGLHRYLGGTRRSSRAPAAARLEPGGVCRRLYSNRCITRIRTTGVTHFHNAPPTPQMGTIDAMQFNVHPRFAPGKPVHCGDDRSIKVCTTHPESRTFPRPRPGQTPSCTGRTGFQHWRSRDRVAAGH